MPPSDTTPKSIAIVTGASSGLGFELASGLAKQGTTTCLVSRDRQRLAEACKQLPTCNPDSVLMYAANVGQEIEVRHVFDFVKTGGFIPTVVINAAGIGRFGDPDKIDQPTINTVFEANLTGLILMSSYALRAMSQGGTIVNIMSTAALVGREKEAVYCAAKWGARGFTEALKLATKGSPISVISVYPGGMNTAFWSKECGLSPNVSKFMRAQDVAKRILDQLFSNDTSVATDLTINRRS